MIASKLYKLGTTICLLMYYTIGIPAQTTLPATFDSDTTLSAANSPYLVNGSLTIEIGVTLKLEAGTILLMSHNAIINAKGNLLVLGTATDSVFIQSEVDGETWSIINTSGDSIEFYYTCIRGSKRFISATGGEKLILSHCSVKSSALLGNGLDCIAAHDTKWVLIENILLEGSGGTIAGGSKNDAIDLDAVDSCFIVNSCITNFSDDAIDIGTLSGYAKIEGNTILHTNYGISIGENSIADIRNNFCAFNDAGIQIHTGSTGNISNNTLYGNTFGIEVFHSEDGTVQSGGKAFISNTIFANSTQFDFIKQASSTLTIDYSLSDKEELPGESNLFGDPLLVDPENNNFWLQAGSPCFNSGSPDGIGGRYNIGVYQEGEAPNVLPTLYANGTLGVNVYPNPATHIVNLTIQGYTGTSGIVRIIGARGNRVKEIALQGEQMSIDISDLSEGNYFIQLIKTDKLYGTYSFVKTR